MKLKSELEEDQEEPVPERHLGYVEQVIPCHRVTVYLDEEIKSPSFIVLF